VSLRAIVLAAGKGTRMKSEHPKMLHALCGRAMLWYVLRALRDAGVDDLLIVTGEQLEPHVGGVAADAGHAAPRIVLQEPQLGTGHAVQMALRELEPRDGTVLVINGDMPLVEADLIRRIIAARDTALVLLTARMPLPSSFGRVVRSGERVERVVEERDATDDERAIDEMNAGLYAYDERKLRAAAAELGDDNAQGEYYLPDTIGWLVARGETVLPVMAEDYRAVLGVNDRVELAVATRRLNERLCEHHMRSGVTIIDPATTYLEPELEIARDVTILPNTAIGRRSAIGAASEIGPNTRLQNARIGANVIVSDSVIVDSEVGDFAIVGPWSHVRGGSVFGTGVRVGNFVEAKNATLAPGAKAAHLSYIGDATVGARTNIGAGTITCNYDGQKKSRTEIGADAFIGSNSSLRAPLRIGDGAVTGAGSVVLHDVPPGGRVAGNPAKPLPSVAPAEAVTSPEAPPVRP
jgi:bifunctional UDP-N-acetylglucosamine pyrophosphorylase / glucosamine-1-phosphate N-acetyltransferase